MGTLRIDQEFRDFLGPLAEEERRQLRDNLHRDGRALDPIVVWEEQDVIVDGHNRYEICTEDDLPYEVSKISFASRADVIAWIVQHQGGRRNMTQERLSYLRGKAYEAAKADKKENLVPGASHQEISKTPTFSSMGQNDPSKERTSKEVAKKTGVGEATVRRDAKFAEAVDRLAGDVKTAVLDKQIKATKAAVIELSAKDQDEQRKLVAAVKAEEFKSVQEALQGKPAASVKPSSNGKPTVDVRKFKDFETAIGKLIRQNTSLKDHAGGTQFHEPIRIALNESLKTLAEWKKWAVKA